MSDSGNYKATFVTNDKYLKYFCENSLSTWTFKKFKNHFQQEKNLKKKYIKQLQTVLAHSLNIPKKSRRDIVGYIQLAQTDDRVDAEMATSSIVYGDNYNVNGDNYNINIKKFTSEGSRKRQRSVSEVTNKEEEEEESFCEKWTQFLLDAEANKNLHKYSPEKHGVLRFGENLSARPTMPKDLYQTLVRDNNKNHTLSDRCVSDLAVIDGIIKKMVKKLTIDALDDSAEELQIRNDEHKLTYKFMKQMLATMVQVFKKKPSITYSEAVYNDLLIFRCMNAVILLLARNQFSPYFISGEEELKAMTVQLKKTGQKVDYRRIYKADGVIRVQKMKYLEILLVETAGSFAKKDDRKLGFDNAKGMFALLAMLKTIADQYFYGTVETFQKIKLYFLQASNDNIRLWSMEYFQNGMYYFVREAKIKISQGFSQKDKVLADMCKFFYMLKVYLEETIELLRLLKEEHESIDDSNSQRSSLADIICPEIFSLSYNKHGKGFGGVNIKSSPESV